MMILQNMSWGRVMASNDIQTQTDRKYLKRYVTTRGAKVAQFNLKMKFKLSTWVLSFAIKTPLDFFKQYTIFTGYVNDKWTFMGFKAPFPTLRVSTSSWPLMCPGFLQDWQYAVTIYKLHVSFFSPTVKQIIVFHKFEQNLTFGFIG